MNNWVYDQTFEFDAPKFCDFANWNDKNLDLWFDFNTPDTSKVMNNIQSNQPQQLTPPSANHGHPNANGSQSLSNSSSKQSGAKINKTPPNHNNKNFVRNSPSMEWKIKGPPEAVPSTPAPVESFPVYSSPALPRGKIPSPRDQPIQPPQPLALPPLTSAELAADELNEQTTNYLVENVLDESSSLSSLSPLPVTNGALLHSPSKQPHHFQQRDPFAPQSMQVQSFQVQRQLKMPPPPQVPTQSHSTAGPLQLDPYNAIENHHSSLFQHPLTSPMESPFGPSPRSASSSSASSTSMTKPASVSNAPPLASTTAPQQPHLKLHFRPTNSNSQSSSASSSGLSSSGPSHANHSHSNSYANSLGLTTGAPSFATGERFVVGSSAQPEYALPLNSSFGLKPSNENDIGLGRVYSENNSIVNTITSAPTASNGRYPARSNNSNEPSFAPQPAQQQQTQQQKRGANAKNSNTAQNGNSKPVNNRNASSFRKQEQWQIKQKPTQPSSAPLSTSSHSSQNSEVTGDDEDSETRPGLDENRLPNYMRPTASTMRRQEAIKQEKIKKKESQLAEVAQLDDRRELTVPMTPDFVRRENNNRNARYQQSK